MNTLSKYFPFLDKKEDSISEIEESESDIEPEPDSKPEIEDYKKFFHTTSISKINEILLKSIPLAKTYKCLHCGRYRAFGDNYHTTWYKHRHLGYLSASPLCNDCWESLPDAEILEYYYKYLNYIKSILSDTGAISNEDLSWEEIWESLRLAVRKESGRQYIDDILF